MSDNQPSPGTANVIEEKILSGAIVYYAQKLVEEVSHDAGLLGLNCPIHPVCAELEEIREEFSPRNAFVAIPYSDYPFEEAILDIVKKAGLVPRLAKDQIESAILLCKVCKTFRKCQYGIVDISQSNLNVVYELGLMQALGKKCAILFCEGSCRPTDLQGIENVIFPNDPKHLQMQLGKWISDNVPEADKMALNTFLTQLALKISGLPCDLTPD